jgi:DNA-directed RNA polymerase subunit RPC12/RpoP
MEQTLYKCPKCQSTNTKMLTVMDLKWQPGNQRCLDCDYQDHFTQFLKYKEQND